MIKPLVQAQSNHSVGCLVTKGGFKKGDQHAIQILPMTGRIFTYNIYEVFESMDEIHKTFNE